MRKSSGKSRLGRRRRRKRDSKMRLAFLGLVPGILC